MRCDRECLNATEEVKQLPAVSRGLIWNFPDRLQAIFLKKTKQSNKALLLSECCEERERPWQWDFLGQVEPERNAGKI